MGFDPVGWVGKAAKSVGHAAENFFDPGKKDRGKAQDAQKQAIAAWKGLGNEIPAQASMQYGTDIKPYETGAPLQVAQTEKYLDPMTAMQFGLAPTSAAYNDSSAYGDIGPSSWENATSAYKSLGPSAAKGLAFDKGDLAAMGEDRDYFQKLAQTGNDPIAEAEYQKRAMQAEQSRKANTDAALAAMEAKGQGNAGGALSARMEGTQAAANDRYQYGLDATAQGAARRDTAAQAGAGIASQMGQNKFSADAARADALDRYAQAKAQGMDEMSARKASGLDAFNTTVAGGKDAFQANQDSALDAWENARRGEMYGVQDANATNAQQVAEENWQRANTVSDTNTGNQNAAAQFNKVQAPQDLFNNQTAVTAGETGQYGQQSGLYQQQSQRDPWWVRPAQVGANIAKAAS